MVKKYKKEDSVSYALGATLVMELIKRRRDFVRAVYVAKKTDVPVVIEQASALGIPVIESEKAFNILCPKENCFAIGVFDKFETRVSQNRSHIVLVNPSNSGNLGTIMRDVAAFDRVDLAIIKPAVDPFDPKTVRASMGAVFNIAFEEFDDFKAYTDKYGGRTVVPFMLGGSPFKNLDFENGKQYALVFGNEATGLPDDFSAYGAVAIEQSKNVDSLNLSAAVSIALYKLYTS